MAGNERQQQHRARRADGANGRAARNGRHFASGSEPVGAPVEAWVPAGAISDDPTGPGRYPGPVDHLAPDAAVGGTTVGGTDVGGTDVGDKAVEDRAPREPRPLPVDVVELGEGAAAASAAGHVGARHSRGPDALDDLEERGTLYAPEATAALRPGLLRGRAQLWELAVLFVVALGCSIALFHSVWQYPFSTQAGSPGDADEYSWFIAWVPWSIAHGLNPLVSHYVNAPGGGVNLMWNTSVILPAFVMWPFTAIWDAAFSYNLLITLGPVLNTVLSYMVLRRWTGRLASLPGALIFGFSPYMVSQSAGHLAQTLIFTAPLVLLMLDRILVVQRSRAWLDGLLFGALIWAQLLTGEEVLAMEAVTGFVAVVVLCALEWHSVRSHLQYAARALSTAAGVFGVLAAPFLAVQFLGPYKVQDVHPANVYLSDLLNFVVPTNITKLAPAGALALSAKFSGNGAEQGAYTSIPIILLLALGLVVCWRRRHMWVAFSCAAAAGIFSMGETLHVAGHNTKFPLPDHWLQHLPVFHNLLPDRFASIYTFGVAWMLALVLDRVHRLPRWRKPVLAGAWTLTAAGMAALFPITNYPAGGSPLYSAFDTGLSCQQPGESGAVAASSSPDRVTSAAQTSSTSTSTTASSSTVPSSSTAAGATATTAATSTTGATASPSTTTATTGTTVPLIAGGQAPLPVHPAPGTGPPPVPQTGRAPVAFLLPVVNELNLRWQAEAHFCFAMPSATGMTGTNSGDAHPRTIMFTVGTPDQPMPPLTLATRAAAVADLEQYHVTEIVVGPEAPSAPGWSPDGQAQLVVWVEWLLGQAPIQSHDIHISYIWKNLPSYEDIATGHVGYVPGEAHN